MTKLNKQNIVKVVYNNSEDNKVKVDDKLTEKIIISSDELFEKTFFEITLLRDYELIPNDLGLYLYKNHFEFENWPDWLIKNSYVKAYVELPNDQTTWNGYGILDQTTLAFRYYWQPEATNYYLYVYWDVGSTSTFNISKKLNLSVILHNERDFYEFSENQT